MELEREKIKTKLLLLKKVFGLNINHSTAIKNSNGKLNFLRIFLPFVFIMFMVVNGRAQTNYYLSAAGAANAQQFLTNWGTNTDGTGANPPNFTTANQIFNITLATAAINAAWTVSGAGSKVVVGNGSSATTFNTGGYLLTGTVDVNASSTLNVTGNAAAPTMGILSPTSLVYFYDGGANMNLPTGNYGNISIGNNGTAWTWTATGNVNVSGSWTQTNSTYATGAFTTKICGNNNTLNPITLSSGGTLEFCGTGNTATINTMNTAGGTYTINVDNGATGNVINALTFQQGTLNINNNLTTGNLTVNATGNLSLTGLGNTNPTTFNQNGTGTTVFSGGMKTTNTKNTYINVNGGTLNVGANSGVSVDFTTSNGPAISAIAVASGATLLTSGSLTWGQNAGASAGLTNLGTTVLGTNASGYSFVRAGNGFSNPITNGSSSNSTASLTLNGAISNTGQTGGTYTNWGIMNVGVTNTTDNYSVYDSQGNSTITNNNTGILNFTGGLYESNNAFTLNNYGAMQIGNILNWSYRNCSIYNSIGLTLTNGSNTYTTASFVSTGAIYINTGNGFNLSNYGCMSCRNIFKTGGTPTINVYTGSNFNFTGSNIVTWGAVAASTAATWTSNTNVALGDYMGGQTNAYLSAISSTTAGTLSSAQTYSANTGNTVISLRGLGGTSTINVSTGTAKSQLSGLGVVAANVSSSAALTNYLNGTPNNITSATNVAGANPTQCGSMTVSVTATPSTICNGSSSVLSATPTNNNGSVTYTWSNGGSGASITVTPSVTITYYVTAVDGTPTTAIGQVVVTVNPTPTVNIPAAAVCGGTSVTLTALPGAATSYAWAATSNPTPAATQMPSVIPTINTTYTVTVTSNGIGCTASNSVNVNTPTAVSNPATICSGGSSILSASAGAAWVWSNSLGSTQTVNPTNITSSTTYTVTVTNGISCSATTSVTVVTASTASNSGPVCSGSNVTLSVIPAGSAYAWTGPSSFNSASQNPLVSPAVAGVYTVVVTYSASCTQTATTTVVVNSLPAASAQSSAAASTICKGTIVTLSANASGGAGPFTYSWVASSGANPAGVANPTASPTVNVTYTVTATDANGCTATSKVSVSVNTLTASAGGVITGGSTVTLGGSPTASGGSGSYTYSWTASPNDNTLTATTASNPTVNPTVNTNYTVTVTDASGCTATDVATVSLIAPNNANVTISTVTAFGNWSGGTTGPYVFTPSANNATINYTDIQNRLNGTGYTAANVTINSGCTVGGCNQAGNVTIANAITAVPATTGLTLAVNAGGSITVNSVCPITLVPTAAGISGVSVTLSAGTGITINSNISVTGKYTGNYENGCSGGSLNFTANTGNINIVSGIMYTNGGSTGFTAGNAGSITMNATTGNITTQDLNALGAYAGNAGGSAGGNISLTAPNASAISTGNITTSGGNGSNGAGGVGGSVTIADHPGTTTIGNINSFAGSTSSYNNAQNGGAININNTGSPQATNVTIGNINNSGGNSCNPGGNASSITIKSGNGFINCGAINSNGGTSCNSSGGNGGVITISTNSNITLGAINNYGNNSVNGNGGSGATVNITSVNGTLNSGVINSYGGNATGIGGPGGAITISTNSNITVSSINNYGGNSSNGTGGTGAAVNITSSNGVIYSGAVNSNGGSVSCYCSAGPGGNVVISTNSTIAGNNNITVGIINSSGGNESNGNTTNTGNGGSVTVSANNGNILVSGVSSNGGICNGCGSNANGGNISITTNSNVSITGNLNTYGQSSNSSSGGYVSITGGSGVTISANINTTAPTTNGNVTISDGGSGDSFSGIYSGGNLVKNSSGTLTISGVNTYAGTTTINGGWVILGTTGTTAATGVIPDGSNISLNSAVLQSNSLVTNTSETMGTFSVTNTLPTIKSNIFLTTSGQNYLYFANSTATLTNPIWVREWQGTAGSGGTYGKILVPSGNAAFAAQFRFVLNDATPNITNVGMLIPFGSIFEVVPQSVVLPIELVSFNAQLQGSTVLLTWQTATETNNNYFTIEKSTDGIHFIILQIVQGAGNSNVPLNYQIVDDNPSRGITYYRLSQTDFNGKEVTFPMVAVNYQPAYNDQLIVFPNPVSGIISLSVCCGINDGNVVLIVRDVLGRICYQNIVTLGDSQVYTIDLKTNKIPGGLYFITAETNNLKLTKKIIVE